MTAYIFDIDGTLSDLSHRLHFITGEKKDWDGFFGAVYEDAVHEHVADVLRALATMWPIVLVSGRSDQARTDTERWLHDNNIPFNMLYMRRQGDHRPDYRVKKDLLGMLVSDGYTPIMAFDDRDQVVKMWRENGIPCAQVADGNF